MYFYTKVFHDGTGMYPGSDVITINSNNNAHDNYKEKNWSGIDVLVYDYSANSNYKTRFRKQ